MKRIVLLLSIIIFTFSCKKSNEKTIVGEISGLPDGRKVFLKKQEDRKIIVIDTAVVKNGKFSFDYKPEDPMIYGIFIDSIRQGIFPMMDKNDKIFIKANKDSLMLVKITGSKLNDDLVSLRKYKEEKTAAIMAKSDEFRKAQIAKDTAVLSRLNDEARAVQKDVAKHEWNYIKSHPNSYVSPLVLSGFLRDPAYKDSVKIVFNNLSEDVKKAKISKALVEYFEKEEAKKQTTNTPMPTAKDVK